MSAPYRLTEPEFRAYQELIQREAGIWLSPAKRALLVGRLSRRLRELGMDSFGAYLRHVTHRDHEELVRMLDCIATNETHFFREPRQFEYIERELLPRLRAEAEAGLRPRRIRAWSAGCSTGQEPYSLAMALLAQCPPSAGWTIDIFATDLSTRALERAQAGVWPVGAAAEIPPQHLKRYMLRGVRRHEGSMQAGPELRAVVRFERLNLSREGQAVPGPFDLVMCRNVLIYFDPAGKERVLSRLRQHVAADGHLFLGHSESLNQADGWRGVRPNVYRREPDEPFGLSAAS